MTTPYTVDQLFTAPTTDQFRAKLVAALLILGIPADKWRAGGVASSMLTVFAATLALMASLLVTVIQAAFLPVATGIGLRLLAYYVYGVTAPEATFANGSLTLTNAGGGVYVVPVGGYTALNPTTGQNYTNTAAFTLSGLSTITIPAACTVQGSIGSAAPGAINVQVTSLIGVTVTNAASFVGLDAISDVALRQLCLDALGALSVRGVRGAYAYAIQTAKNSVTQAPVNINRWSILADSHTGVVTVYVASPSGVPDANDVTGVITNIELLARPDAVTVNVSGAITTTYNPTITIWCTTATAVSAAAIQTAAANAISDFISTYAIGGETANDDSHPSSTFTGLFGDAIKAAIGEGLFAIGVKVISIQGATDLSLVSDAVATDSVTLSIRILTSTGGST